MSFPHRIAGNIALVAWAKEGGLVAGSYAIDASECDMLINRTRRCAQR